MKESRLTRYSNQAWISLALGAGTLGLGSLSQPEAPIWSRWLALAVVQAALGGFSAAFGDVEAEPLQRLALKTLLWPVLTAGIAGGAQAVGVETSGGGGGV